MKYLLPLLLVLLFAVSAAGKPWRPIPRPDAGCGVVVIPQPEELVLFETPGVRRLAEMKAAAIPHLNRSEAESILPVTAKKGEWLRVAYDDAGREGWLLMERPWRFALWDDFLKGRLASLPKGYKGSLYVVRHDGAETADELLTLKPGQEFRVVQVRDDWVQVLVDVTRAGWLRWRDRDGRVLLALP